MAQRNEACPRTGASPSASASMSATSSSRRPISSAMASTSRRGSRPSPSPAASVSRRRVSQVRGKLDVDFQDTGEQRLKNIARPVRVYRFRPDAQASAGKASRAALALPDMPSIAVLPVSEPERRSRAGLLRRRHRRRHHHGPLAPHWLFVIARNSTFTYKGKPST